MDRAAADEARRRRRPGRLDACGRALEARFSERLFIAKSLPYFLELASPAISKGSGCAFVAEHLGFAAEADGRLRRRRERLELIEWPARDRGRQRAAALRERADWVCPDAADEGVAQVLEALLDLRT